MEPPPHGGGFVVSGGAGPEHLCLPRRQVHDRPLRSAPAPRCELGRHDDAARIDRKARRPWPSGPPPWPSTPGRARGGATTRGATRRGPRSDARAHATHERGVVERIERLLLDVDAEAAATDHGDEERAAAVRDADVDAGQAAWAGLATGGVSSNPAQCRPRRDVTRSRTQSRAVARARRSSSAGAAGGRGAVAAASVGDASRPTGPPMRQCTPVDVVDSSTVDGAGCTAARVTP